MTLKNLTASLFSLILFCSCADKKLNLRIVENKDIKIELYTISRITTMHDYCDITNKRWNKTERIYEVNSQLKDSLYIKNDSIIIQSEVKKRDFYDLAAMKFGYEIVLVEPEK